MDIPLHYFDEYVGDAIYRHLVNPFAAGSSSRLQPLVLLHHAASTAASNLTSAAASPLSRPSTLPAFLASLPPVAPLPRDNWLRQSLSLYLITYVGILLLYFTVATFSYYYIFDHRMKQHPRFLKNQVAMEIAFSLEAFPWLDLMTLPWFVGDVRGYSMMYDTIAEGPFGSSDYKWMPWAYMIAASGAFLVFTDFLIYWIHRSEHHPSVYKWLHKPHHKWIIPTPFASHAFHPLDGYLQSLPYHMACYIIPLHKHLFIGLFTLVNLWSIFIHDGELVANSTLEKYINGPSHHTLHHLYFTVDYGQYFQYCDSLFGTHRAPATGDDPLLAVLAAQARRQQAVADEALRAEKAEERGSSPLIERVPSTAGSLSSSSEESSGASEREDETSWLEMPLLPVDPLTRKRQ